MTTARRRRSSRDLALVAVFAAMVAVLGLVPAWYPLGAAVPVTAQSLGVMLAGSVIGARRGFAALALFVALVAAGLPLLAGGRGGLAVFAGPSVGFIVGFPFAAFATGWLTERALPRYGYVTGLAANLLGGVVVLYAFGIPGMMWRADLSLPAALTANAAFVPGDVAKAVVATIVAKGVHAAYPRFAEESRVRRDALAAR